jgi:Mrp family chromosome partitioning ATPase
MQKEVLNVTQYVVRLKAEEIKKALFNSNQDTIVKKATKIGSSIYLNVTGIIENNTFYKVIKEEDKIVLTKIDVEELLRD